MQFGLKVYEIGWLNYTVSLDSKQNTNYHSSDRQLYNVPEIIRIDEQNYRVQYKYCC